MMAYSGVVNGSDLLIGGIDQCKNDQKNLKDYADRIGAEYVPTFLGNPVTVGIPAVRAATPHEKFYSKDPETGIIIMKEPKYKATKENGLTSPQLNSKEYDTIYAHSGGTRTAVTALLYQKVKADRLVLISPTTGDYNNQDLFNWELQQLLDFEIVNSITVYQADQDNAFEWARWQAKSKEGDIKGNFEP